LNLISTVSLALRPNRSIHRRRLLYCDNRLLYYRINKQWVTAPSFPEAGEMDKKRSKYLLIPRYNIYARDICTFSIRRLHASVAELGG